MGELGFVVDIVPSEGNESLEFTFYWPESNAWLGRNYVLRIEKTLLSQTEESSNAIG
jgi:hypothetical protein